MLPDRGRPARNEREARKVSSLGEDFVHHYCTPNAGGTLAIRSTHERKGHDGRAPSTFHSNQGGLSVAA
jgi:hypothetical protein